MTSAKVSSKDKSPYNPRLRATCVMQQAHAARRGYLHLDKTRPGYAACARHHRSSATSPVSGDQMRETAASVESRRKSEKRALIIALYGFQKAATRAL